MEEPIQHYSVMRDEIVRFAQEHLANRKEALIVDGTLGEGGHTAALRRAFPEARIVALDRDPEMVLKAKERLEREGIFVHIVDSLGPPVVPGVPPGPSASGEGNPQGTRSEKEVGGVEILGIPFGRLGDSLSQAGLLADLVLLDLGVSIHHFRTLERGFSYTDERLDMRLSPDLPRTAADLVNDLTEAELADLFFTYGEERHSRRIARSIVAKRPVESARELASLVAASVPRAPGGRGAGGSSIHPATRVFQALRIVVNRELEELEEALEKIPGRLSPDGLFMVISFHSLEDRLVKNGFRHLGEKRRRERKSYGNREKAPVESDVAQYWILTPKPLYPSEEETRRNPPSRSAKLRILQKKADIESI